MNKKIVIDKKIISEESPTYIIAEMSGNHNMSFDRAKEIIYMLKDSGTDAIKLQTYTADTITIDSNRPEFQIDGGLWDGENLYSLYKKAFTPWEWQKELMEYANSLGLSCFSSPFDLTAVDFIDDIGMPAYKIASYEINDIPMIRKIAKKRKPVIISTGVAYLADIERAIKACKEEGNEDVILLKCTSAYPCPYEDMNIKTIPLMKETFDCLVGLSDHSFGDEVAIGAIGLGANVIEKHVTIRREDGGPDSGFSMNMDEFVEMVKRIRNVEKAIGKGTFELRPKQIKERMDMRSLYVVKEVKKGEVFTDENIKSIRPSCGLHPIYYEYVIGKTAAYDIHKGVPMEFGMVEGLEIIDV